MIRVVIDTRETDLWALCAPYTDISGNEGWIAERRNLDIGDISFYLNDISGAPLVTLERKRVDDLLTKGWTLSGAAGAAFSVAWRGDQCGVYRGGAILDAESNQLLVSRGVHRNSFTADLAAPPVSLYDSCHPGIKSR